MRITDALLTGSENATTGRELAAVFNCDIRAITAQIEKERREGAPICATSRGDNPGYFLPANDQELTDYCERLKNRAIELFRTRQALIKTLKQYQADREAAENDQEEPDRDQR